MSGTDEKLVQASQILRLLNWKNVFKISVISIISMILITVWMFRATLLL
jgi:hypothetical protein